MTLTYEEFLAARAQLAPGCGFEPTYLPDYLFPFQRDLVTWAVRQGRCAIFADCGMGKTPMGLVWAENVRMHTGKPVLIVTPLAVAFQIEQEADKFGIEAAVSRDGSVAAGVTITNYEQLEKFDPEAFGGVVCDESSAIKSFDGVRRAIVTEFLRTRPYRLLCTATAAPNDYVELGTSSEALGQLGHVDMLNRFFTNKQKTSAQNRMAGHATEWRFKGHAEEAFWRWVASWARAVRRPSDIGYDDGAFILPPLEYREHVVIARAPAEGALFDVPAVGMREERAETRRTIGERCEAAASAVRGHDTSIVWCNLNDEGDLLEKLIPNSIQVRGSDSPEFKESAARWFKGDLCLCELTEFRAKLAAWHGNQSMQQLAEPSISQIPPSGNGARPKGEPQTKTASTCAPTTVPTRTSGSQHQNDLSVRTPLDATATPKIQSGARNTLQRSRSGSAPILTRDMPSDFASTGSPGPDITKCSPSRAGSVQSAERITPETDGQLCSLSTTVTPRVESEDSCAPRATSESESLATSPSDSNVRPCMCGHISGVRRLISKPVMFGLGLNFQHCSHVVFFPTWSYEQMYQAIRRCWRFGQESPVIVDVIASEGGVNALHGLQRKAAQADAMFSALVSHMNDAVNIDRSVTYDQEVRIPQWV